MKQLGARVTGVSWQSPGCPDAAAVRWDDGQPALIAIENKNMTLHSFPT